MHTSRWILTAVLGLAPVAHADVRLPALFTDNMVLQRDVAAPIWGWADDGEQITIEINGKQIRTTAIDGKFKAKLPRLKALNVPIGLIHTSWGGSPAEVWMSEEVLSANPEYKRDILDAYTTQEANYKSALAAWEKDKADAEKEGTTFTKQRPNPGWRPT